MDNVTLLKKLVEYRETHNLTQAELANILGVTRESLYRWGFTPQKPRKKSYDQQSKAVQNWLDNEYPDVKKICN